MPSPTVNEAREAVYAHFNTIWADAAPLAYDNQQVTPPIDSATPWARIFFLVQEKPQISFGNKGRWEQAGTVVVQIFTGLGRGTSEADNLANIASDAFNGKKTANPVVRFYENRTLPGRDDGNWYQTEVTARFRYVEVP